MATKTIELDEEVLEFTMARCEADIVLGLQTAEAYAMRNDVMRGKKAMDLVVINKRLKAALERAR